VYTDLLKPLVPQNKKGQRGTSTERKIFCELPDAAHPDIAKPLTYFDSVRTKFSAGKLPDTRWVNSHREPRLSAKQKPSQLGYNRYFAQRRRARTTSGRFSVDFALTTQGCMYSSVQHRYPNALYQVLWRLGQIVGRSPRLHRPSTTPDPGSLATIWLDEAWWSPTQRHTPVGDGWHK
jgi:hypothetical protein